ncbi:MAG: methyltransferase domain-containing protein [Planctomycetota bacterium]|nr:methyltransferase domain-containing protein [Planctomycetota bacterium]
MKSISRPHLDPAALIQFEPESYANLRYDSKRRFCSYWHQLNETHNVGARTVAEIGVGSRFTSTYLQRQGIQHTSIDIDARLNPTITASVLDIPLEDNLFDVAVCFEVLEHLPF